MMKDNAIKKEIQAEWDGVRKFQGKIQLHLNISNGVIGGGASHELRNISHNLTLLFAFSVLETVLKQLHYEKVFLAGDNKLGTLMHSSKNTINWIDFKLVDEAREERNKVAHDQKTLERADCWKFIDAIEEELIAWNIVVNPYIFSH